MTGRYLLISILLVCSAIAKADIIDVAESTDSSMLIIDSVIIEGNRKTKDYILLKQMVVQTGDTVNSIELEELCARSAKNIFNLGLFLKAHVVPFESSQGRVHLLVQVQERWFVFPKPWVDLADRNFNYWWVEQGADLSRLEYGLDLIHYNLSGHNDQLNLRTVLGFTQKIEIQYERPFITPNSETGFGLFGMYARNRQSFINTVNNEQFFFESPQFLRDRIKAGIYTRHRKGPYQLHLVQVRYNQTEVLDTVAVLNPNYLGEGRTEQQFFSIFYSYIMEKVDNRSYPLEGNFARIDLQKRGLGIFEDVDQYYISLQYNHFLPLSDKWFLGAMGAARLNIAEEYPYFLAESLGYCEYFVRGFEYYVVDGQAWGLFRSNLRFKALDTNIESPLFANTPFGSIPVQAYFKVFADAGYVSDNTFTETNTLNNEFLYSAGLGLDVTTYYDWVFRVEGAVNSLGEIGVYLHIGLDLNTYENCSLW